MPTAPAGRGVANAYSGTGSACRAEDALQSVSKPPGSTRVTATPSSPTSAANDSEIASRAHFDAWWAPRFANAPTPPMLEICTMWPPRWPRMIGSAARSVT